MRIGHGTATIGMTLPKVLKATGHHTAGKHDIVPFHAMMYVVRTSACCGGAMEEQLRSRMQVDERLVTKCRTGE